MGEKKGEDEEVWKNKKKVTHDRASHRSREAVTKEDEVTEGEIKEK